MKRFIALLLTVLLCVSMCSCNARAGKKTIENQNEMSEFLAGKQIMAFLNDGSILCCSSSRTETVPGRTENTYYRYYPDDDTSVLIEESGAIDNLFSVNDIKTGEDDNLYFMGRMKDDGGYGCVKFDVATDSFVTAGENEKINSDYITAKSLVTDFDVNYTDGEKYYYIVDESEQKSYFYTYDKDGNMLISLDLPGKFNDVREKYGSFTHMYVSDKYLILGISNMSYSAVLEIKDKSLKVISEVSDGRISLGYDPLYGANPVMHGKNRLSVFDMQTGKLSVSGSVSREGCAIQTVWQIIDSVLIQASDEEGGNAYFIAPVKDLPDVRLGDEDTVYY